MSATRTAALALAIVAALALSTSARAQIPLEALRTERPGVSGDRAIGDRAIGREIREFILSAADGSEAALADYRPERGLVVFFMGTTCPIANLYLTQIAKLQTDFAAQGIQTIGIHSSAGVERAKIAAHAEEYKVAFPVLHDPEGRVADLFGATRTAEVFVLDARRKIRYHGRVDDRFGYTYKRAEPRRRDLRLAIAELAAGKKISVPSTPPAGCLITRRTDERAGTITYAKEIARIIDKRCLECHRPGMIGPFSLTTYDETTQQTDMIKEVVTQRRMPPWHADPRYGQFSNSRRMPQEEVDQLIAWIDGGAPFGNENDLPPPKEYAPGWTIDKPDLVFRLPEEVTIPADGVVPYLYYHVPTNFEQDMWVQAAEARPDNRAVVHHIIVFIREPNAKPSRQHGRLLVGTAPGDPPMMLPPGIAKRVPKGSELLFQMHYTPTGKVEKDRSEIGLIFYKGEGPPRALAETRSILNFRFEIPAGDPNFEVRSRFVFPRAGKILGLMPHMHLRGKDFLYRATYPSGESEILLSVPAYDFNWQNGYSFAEPIAAPKGTRIDCIAHFDNSAANPANPDPTLDVRWGDQTWEEMMIGWITYVWDDGRENADETD